jgi:HSP20 family protein
MTIRKWKGRMPGGTTDAFERVHVLRDEMDRLFSDFFETGRAGDPRKTWVPLIDVLDRDGEYVVLAEIPGVSREDIRLVAEGDRFVIEGRRPPEGGEKEGSYHRMERPHGQFRRVVELPGPITASKVKAVLRDGVLEIVLPKAVESTARVIRVVLE